VSVLCPAFVQTRIYDSERNRPQQYQSETDNVADKNSFSSKTKQMVDNGIEVSIVGKRVVEALNDGEFYIFTHPNYRAVMKQRSDAIDAAFKKAGESPLLQHVVNQKLDML
jgi:hypothetical protein